jgi:hypothetical protein
MSGTRCGGNEVFITVRAGEQVWRVKAKRVSDWVFSETKLAEAMNRSGGRTRGRFQRRNESKTAQGMQAP